MSFLIKCCAGAALAFCSLVVANCSDTKSEIAAKTSSDAEDSNVETAAIFERFEYEGRDPEYLIGKSENEYWNPILPGSYPDPTIMRVEDDYYLALSSFGYFPGLPVFHSKDLVNWSLVSNAIDRPGMLDIDSVSFSRRGVWGPTIEYHNGRYSIASACSDCGGNFIVTADRPEGPWSDPIWLTDVGGFDPMLYFEGDKGWLLYHADPPGGPQYKAHGAIWIQEIDPVSFDRLSEPHMIVDRGSNVEEEPIYVEGPHIYKVDDYYFLSVAEGGTGLQHRQVVFRSKDLLGPYEPYENNPILSQAGLPFDQPNRITTTGHADLVETQNGDWWAVFLGTRNYTEKDYSAGRETYLMPVSWETGWPVIMSNDQRMPHKMSKPDLPEFVADGVLLRGNFEIKDEFDTELGDDWVFIRAPETTWWETGEGELIIHPNGERLDNGRQPSIVSRRIQHNYFTAKTEVSLSASNSETEAGLVIYKSNLAYFTLGLVNNELGQAVLRLRERAGKDDVVGGRVLVEKVLGKTGDDNVELSIEMDGPIISFFYTYGDGVPQPLLVNGDASIVSPIRSWDFIGAMIGLYAAAE